MPYTNTTPCRLYYEIHGTGTPLILISGLGGDLSFWSDSIARLQSHFQVIVFDNRGIGRSDAPDVPYSVEVMADDVAALLTELQVERAHMLGFSMGGCIAQALALKHPHALDKLILAATYARMGRQSELFLDAVLDVYEHAATPKQMYNLILPWLFSPKFLSQPENTAFLEFDENDPLNQPLYAFRKQYLAQKAFDVRDSLSQVQAPTLVLAGEQDALVPVQDTQALAHGIDGARHILFPEAGHLFNLEQPDHFHSEVLGFLIESP